MSQIVSNYSGKLEKIMCRFIKKVSKFNITSAFYLKQQNYNKRNLIYDLKNNIFESEFSKPKEKNIEIKNCDQVDAFFNDVKKSIYKKEDQKEILLDNNNEYPKFNNEKKLFAEKFLRRSSIFQNKNIKFYDEKPNLRNSNENKNTTRNSLVSINNEEFKDKLFKRKFTINTNKTLETITLNENDFDRSEINHKNSLNIKNNLNNVLTNNINNNLNINKFQLNNINPYTNQKNIYNNNYNRIPTYNNGINYGVIPNNINHNRNAFEIPKYTNSNFEFNIQPINNFCPPEESQKLKQLLFCTRVIIEKTLETNIAFNNCYRLISENYLSNTISKKVKEERLKEKKKFKKRNTILNIPRKIVPVKKKIIGASEKNFEILFNMIMGIQIAVQSIPNFRIKENEDIIKYLTKMIYSVQSVYLGKENEESYILKEFGGVIFNNIRLYLGINKEEFIKSISPQDFITELMISSQTIFEELCSTGSSGSLLYYTRDGEFIVKTISKKEYKFLKKILGQYFFYLKDNPISFLPKILGCYVLRRKFKKKITNIYFIVMTNVFATDRHIDLRFDLKGSTIGRKVLTGTINDSKVFSKGDMALKDLDFNKINEKVYISSKRDKILEQLKKDIEFLYKINSNDYSLLLGIHCIKDIERCTLSKTTTVKTTEYRRDDLSICTGYSKEFLFTNTIDTESISEYSAVDRINILKTIYDFEDGGILSDNKKRIYYFGIIDILTEFNSYKQLEYMYKRIRYCSENMSCVPPMYYKQRFYNYLAFVFSKQSKDEINQNITDSNIYENNNNKKNLFNIDKYGAISSSRYKQYKKEEKEAEKFEKYTAEDSIQKFNNNNS